MKNFIIKNWFRVAVVILLFVILLVVMADYGAKAKIEERSRLLVSSEPVQNTLPTIANSTETQDKDAYIKQLETYAADAEKKNKQWVVAQSNWDKMKADYEAQIAKITAEKQSIIHTTVARFQTQINNLSMNMTDPSWKNSLVNDMTGLVPQPGIYTQAMADTDRKIALINAYAWAGVGICSLLDDYIKVGLISSRGESCESRANIGSQIK